MRSAPFMESLVSIYRSLDATSVNTLFQSVPCGKMFCITTTNCSIFQIYYDTLVKYSIILMMDYCCICLDAGKKLNLSAASVKINSVDGMKNELNQVAADGNSSSGTFFPLLAKKCSHDVLNGSAEEKMLNENPIKSAIPGGIQAHLELTGLDASVFNAGGRVTNFQSPVEDGSVKHEVNKVEEIDMNQMGQLSPACTDSLGDINDNSSDPASCRDAKRHKKSNSEDTGGVCAFCHSSEVTDVSSLIYDLRCTLLTAFVFLVCNRPTLTLFYRLFRDPVGGKTIIHLVILLIDQLLLCGVFRKLGR